MKVKMQLLSFNDGSKLVVDIADPMGTSKEMPMKCVMWWMIHTLGLSLGDTRVLTELAIKSPGRGVTVAEREMDEAIELLERLNPEWMGKLNPQKGVVEL